MKLLLIVTILFFAIAPCFADIDEARITYKKGNTTEALIIYENWLLNNQKTSNFSSVLFEISELRGNVNEISEILEKQIDFVQDRDERKTLYIKLAQLFELFGDLENAQVYYQKAALLSLERIDYDLLLSSAGILLLEGEFLLAESQLEEIIINCSDKNISVKAKILFTVLQILDSSGADINYEGFPFEKPESIYLMYLIAKANSETVIVDSLSEKLVKDFPNSPEAGLMRKELSELPDLLTSLGLLNEQVSETISISDTDTILNYMIQTGSFRDPENAYYLSIDLADKGFDPKVEEQIINDIKYFKVIIYFSTQEDMHNALKLLKESGFQGFPVY